MKESFQTQLFRKTQRGQAIRVRIYKFGKNGETCNCDLCGISPASDYHEIISRSQTSHNERARHISYSKELCSMVCNDCHLSYGHTVESTKLLIKKNISIFGINAVRTVLESMYDISPKTVQKEWEDVLNE